MPGDVTDKACELVFDELIKIIGFEMQAQAMGLKTDATASGACWHPSCVKPARHDGPCVDGFLRRQPLPEGCAEPMEPELLEGLVRRVAASISVIPGMEVVMKNSLSPALWQPSFIICIGSGQVRVLTLAFVGDPVSGDRPSSKSTPFVLRLVTPDLVPAPADSHSPGPTQYCIRNALVGAETVAMQLADLAEELFTASAAGDWTSITKGEVNLPSARSISATPKPQICVSPPETRGPPQPQVGRACTSGSPTRRPSRLAQPRSPSPGPTPDQALVSRTVQPTVSVLADGFSVKAITSAWNNKQAGSSATVSVLADGFSVKAITSAWNNITSRKLGKLVAQARTHSPGWAHAKASASVSQHHHRQSSVKRRATVSAFESSPAQPQVMDRAARVRERINRSQARPS
eukprot:CAMPEP_0172934624 /NCGR_PEP_ID=MMETSP1075-20121228/221106_1 /TAXON_ID=2916 /ORGANISM="Ceratium fusus, Strain PA161109" /LENGTH=404 /DNA_ID=CAMNT_0013795979 /DNA_START=189 /DNA_END=1404 /DNA_ORIENTATION=-